jgi:hypothetical protein
LFVNNLSYYFSEILVQVLWQTERGTGPNLQRRNTDTEAKTETEAETEKEAETETETEAETEKEAETERGERNGNTNIEDQALVQGKKLLTS